MRIDLLRDGAVVLSIVDRPELAVNRAVAAVKAISVDEVRLARREWAERLKEAILDADAPLPPIVVGRFKHEPPSMPKTLLTPLGLSLLNRANMARRVRLEVSDREVARAWLLKHLSSKPVVKRYDLASDAWIVTDSLSKARTHEHYVVFKNLKPAEPTPRWLAGLRVACDCPWHLRWRCYNAELLCTHACLVLLDEAPWMFKPLSKHEAVDYAMRTDRSLLRRMSPELKVALLGAAVGMEEVATYGA